ncbi:MAG: methyltransferase domain-containing protein [Desulfurococcales archaeon]|nr:methyltransferase domain-containing protein [Desulfurococcales archaeon]
MEQAGGWISEFFISRGWLFGHVLRARREHGVEEARLIARLLEEHGVPRGSRVIDLGCGSGRISVPLAREGYRVTCLDISPKYVEEALEYARTMGVEDRVDGIVGDAWRVDELVKGSYDAALIVWTTLLGYRESPEADVELLSRIRRITSPEGKLFILRQTDRDLIVARNAHCGTDVIAGDLGDLLVMERPRFDPVTSILENTWAYYRKRGDELEFLGKSSFRMRIYSISELVDMASRAGWRLEALYGNLNRDPFIPGRTSVNAVFKTS